jgi:thiamine kinase-like enzyme
MAAKVLEGVEHELERMQIPEAMTYERACRDELLTRLRQLPRTSERPLVTAFGHGDLTSGNIIPTNSGALFLID